MNKPPIYFDLDGTLWKSDHPLLEPAWRRLKVGFESVVGPLPDNFNWKSHAGSTDLGVVSGLLRSINPELPNLFSTSFKIIDVMNNYYLEHASHDINPAVFPDVVPGLTMLREKGYQLGVVTGNSRPVTEMKLSSANLLGFFELGLILTGDMTTTRTELLISATLQSNNMTYSNEIGHTIYVADTLADLTGLSNVHEDRMLEIQKLFIFLRNPLENFVFNPYELAKYLNPFNQGKLKIFLFRELGFNFVKAVESRKYSLTTGIERV